MTYKEFKKKYTGKIVDYDKCYGGQCWDLAQQYFVEALKLPSSILSGCGLVSNMLKGKKYTQLTKYFDEISYKDAKQGDIGIWEYGHIALYDKKVLNTLYWFSQNPNKPKVITIAKGTKGLHCFKLIEKKKTTDKLNLREKVGTKSKIILTIPKNKNVSIITRDYKKANGYTWDKVKYDGKIGYVANKWLS